MRTLFLVISCAILVSCTDKKEDKSVLTKALDDVKYLNEYFGLEVAKPTGWYSQDPEVTLKMSEKGANLVVGSDRNMNAMVEESLKSTVPVFAFFGNIPGAPVKKNPSVVSVAENVSILPGIKSGCDYLYHARQILENSPLDVTLSAGCNTVNVNESKFGYFDVNMNVNGTEILQRYYACIKDQHAISVIQTYFDSASKADVDAVLNSIHVECV